MSDEFDYFQKASCELERRLRYTFKDRTLLEASLYHHKVGLTGEGRELKRDSIHFELTEKIGDGILKVAAQDILVQMYPRISAGELTRRESVVTCNDNLAHLTQRLQIPKFFKRSSYMRYRKKTLADTMESIFYAIALDEGNGDVLQGIPAVRNVCRHLFRIELATCQISSPYVILNNLSRSYGENIRITYKSTFYRNVISGFVAKLSFGKKIARMLGQRDFVGTGFTAESAMDKASAVVLLVLDKKNYPSDIQTLKHFSWKIV